MTRLLARPLPWAAALLMTLAGCQTGGTISISPPPELADAPRWNVAGRQGWLSQRKLRFGDFRTTDVESSTQKQRTEQCPNGCWNVELSRLYASQFDQAFHTAKQRLTFRQVDAHGGSAAVRAYADSRVEQTEWRTRWFGVTVDSGHIKSRQQTIYGTIAPAAEGASPWRFWLGESSGLVQTALGNAQDDEGHHLEIRPWNEVPDSMMPAVRLAGGSGAVPGYALVMDGRHVAAVDTFVGGHVWIDPQLPPDRQLVIASLCSMLLLRAQFAPSPGASF